MNLKEIIEEFDEKYTNKIDKYNPFRRELLELYGEQKQFISTKITKLLEELRVEDKKYDNLDSRVSNDIRTMTKNDGYNQRNQEINDKINKILNK